MTRCPPLYGRNTRLKKKKVRKRVKRVATLEEEKIMKWVVDDKEDWEGKKKSRWTIGKLRKWYRKNSLSGKRCLGKQS